MVSQGFFGYTSNDVVTVLARKPPLIVLVELVALSVIQVSSWIEARSDTRYSTTLLQHAVE